MRRAQNGKLQAYLSYVAVGAIVLVVAAVFLKGG
jgi:hypothetical protein